jgi:hypothetical protein
MTGVMERRRERRFDATVRTVPNPVLGRIRSFLLLPRLAVGIDDVASLVLGRPQDHLLGTLAKLLQVAGDDVLELGEQLARFRPFAVLADATSPTTVWKVLLRM